jgi:hypothetical protein
VDPTFHESKDLTSRLRDVLEILARLPAPQEVLALRPSAALQERISALLDRQRNGGLSADEEREWEQYKYVEHLVRIAKAKAVLKLHGTGKKG